jgi:hypothetical protein
MSAFRNRVVAALVIALVAAPAPAFAVKKKPPVICNLVKDATGDAGVLSNAGGATTYDPSLDVLSADIGVTGTMLTAVIRVKDLTQTDNLAATGRTWAISFANGTASVGLNAYLSTAGGEQFNTSKGIFDYAHDQIRIHVALADLPNAKIKKNSVLRGFYVTSNVVVGLDPTLNAGYSFAPLGAPADSTDTTTASFKVGAASCVKVGA